MCTFLYTKEHVSSEEGIQTRGLCVHGGKKNRWTLLGAKKTDKAEDTPSKAVSLSFLLCAALSVTTGPEQSVAETARQWKRQPGQERGWRSLEDTQTTAQEGLRPHWLGSAKVPVLMASLPRVCALWPVCERSQSALPCHSNSQIQEVRTAELHVPVGGLGLDV